MNPPMTSLGGTLVRGDLAWHWSDGTPAPHVEDLTLASHYNFRIRGRGDAKFVEVLYSTASEELDLSWAVEGYLKGRFNGGSSGDHTGSIGYPHIHPVTGKPLSGSPPKVILVPIEEWDARSSFAPIGACWDREHEEEILAKARSLGWRPA